MSLLCCYIALQENLFQMRVALFCTSAKVNIDWEEFVRVFFARFLVQCYVFLRRSTVVEARLILGARKVDISLFATTPATLHTFSYSSRRKKIFFFSILQLHSMPSKHTHVPVEKVCFVPTSGQKNNRQPYLFCTMCA